MVLPSACTAAVLLLGTRTAVALIRAHRCRAPQHGDGCFIMYNLCETTVSRDFMCVPFGVFHLL
jgi:hypothetical protein